jgi:hypothetical protein
MSPFLNNRRHVPMCIFQFYQPYFHICICWCNIAHSVSPEKFHRALLVDTNRFQDQLLLHTVKLDYKVLRYIYVINVPNWTSKWRLLWSLAQAWLYLFFTVKFKNGKAQKQEVKECVWKKPFKMNSFERRYQLSSKQQFCSQRIVFCVCVLKFVDTFLIVARIFLIDSGQLT